MGKPFIHLVNTPNSAYFLDVNKDEIVPISFDAYAYLSNVMNDEIEWDVTSVAELSNLYDQGFLSIDSNVKTVQHSFTEHYEIFLHRNLSKIALQLTQDCNFRCKYCVYSENSSSLQRSHSVKSMTWDTAKRAIDFLWNHSVDSKDIFIAFYGGEPLMNFPLMKEVIDYSKKRFWGKKITFNITTNGSLLSDDVILYLAEQNVNIMISLDGPKDINDANRITANGEGTYDIVIARINRINELLPDYAKHLSISMVMDPVNDFDCFNTVMLNNFDMERMRLQPSLIDRSFDDATSSFSHDFIWKREYQLFLTVLSYMSRISTKETSLLLEKGFNLNLKEFSDYNIKTDLFPIDSPSGPCIPGCSRLFTTVDGDLFPCERVSETSPAMCIGTIDTGFDMSKSMNMLNVASITSDSCCECWCFRYCMMCAKHADNGSSDLSKHTRLSFCSKHKVTANEKIKLYILIKESLYYYSKQTRQPRKDVQ